MTSKFEPHPKGPSMSLEWLVAIIRPLDILGKRSRNLTASQELAAIVSGEHWRLDRTRLDGFLSDDIDDSSPLQQWAAQLMQESSIGIAFEQAARILQNRTAGPWTVTLCLLAASAASELEELDRALEILGGQLSQLSPESDGDDQLLRGALLLQLGIRSRDAGRPFKEFYTSATESIVRINPSQCSSFATETSEPEGHRISIQEIIAAFRHTAIASSGFDELSTGRPERTIRGIDTLQRIESQEVDQFSNFLRSVFEKNMKSQSVRFGGNTDGDLFYSTLALELLGHPRVYDARRELAQLRFAQAAAGTSGTNQLADSIRLFRHAGASKELGLALRWLRTGGPLEALSRDARLIIRLALTSSRLRTVELQVLEATAELLTTAESKNALDAILGSLKMGPPTDLPNHWQAETTRYEAAWKALAALSDGADETDRVASYFWEVANDLMVRPDELLDRALARAIRRLDWIRVSAAVRELWIAWHGRTSDTPDPIAGSSRAAIAAALDRQHPEMTIGRPADLDGVAAALNSHLRRGQHGPSPTSLRSSETLDLITRALQRIQYEASQGSHSMRSLLAADVAAATIDVADADTLWPALADFLIDQRVARQDKSASLERLARSGRALPGVIREKFAMAATELLEQSRRLVFDHDIFPYPAALRFLSAHRIISDDYALSCISRLAGSLGPRGREEAAATLAVLARRPDQSPSWLLPLAIQLSYDEDVEVRARAARALTAFTGGSSESPSAVNRLVDLLREDGLSLPVQILSEMRPEELDQVGASVREAISLLATEHPSRTIRSHAGKLVEVL